MYENNCFKYYTVKRDLKINNHKSEQLEYEFILKIRNKTKIEL